MSEMLKLAKLLLFIHATNAGPINFSNEIQQNLFYKKLNWEYVQKYYPYPLPKSNQPNLAEVAKDFK